MRIEILKRRGKSAEKRMKKYQDRISRKIKKGEKKDEHC